MSSSLNDVAAMGISTFMYFKTVINLILLLVVALVVFGVFAFASNVKASNIWNDLGG